MAKKQTMDHAQLLVLSLLAGEDMYGYQMSWPADPTTPLR